MKSWVKGQEREWKERKKERTSKSRGNFRSGIEICKECHMVMDWCKCEKESNG